MCLETPKKHWTEAFIYFIIFIMMKYQKMPNPADGDFILIYLFITHFI